MARWVGRLALIASLQVGLAIDTVHPSPDDEVLAREIKLACTQGMLMLLSRAERLALVLVDLFELTSPEAAVIAGVPPPTLRKRLSRARQRLGGFLRAQCGLVNESASCRCHRQVAAKQWLGRFSSPPRAECV